MEGQGVANFDSLEDEIVRSANIDLQEVGKAVDIGVEPVDSSCNAETSFSNSFLNMCWQVSDMKVMSLCPMKIHKSLLLVFVLGFVIGGIKADWLGLTWGMLVCGPILFFSVLTQGITHAAFSNLLGIGEVKGIWVWPLGGLAKVEHKQGVWQDTILSLAGISSYIVTMCIWLIMLALSNEGHITWNMPELDNDSLWRSACIAGLRIQVFLLTFSLIPVQPFPGGTMLVSFFLDFGFSETYAGEATAALPTLISLAYFLLGAVLDNVVFVLVSVWVVYEAWTMFEQCGTGMIQEHPLIVNAKNVMASQQRGRLSKAMTDAESPSLRPETPISISPGRQISPVYEPGLGSPGVPPPIE